MTSPPVSAAEVAAELRKLAEKYDAIDPAKAERYRTAAKVHDDIALEQKRKPA